MKTLEEVNQNLKAWENKYKLRVQGSMQGTEEWFRVKLGVVSSSNIQKAIAKKASQTRETYLCELVAQVLSGYMKDISAAAIDWGRNAEDSARSAYEFGTEKTISELPFVFKDETFREGCSPDGVLLDEKKGIEIKAPYDTTNHVKFLLMDTIKSEYQWQVQFMMRCMDADCWDFCSFDPRCKAKSMKIFTVVRDEEKQKKMADDIPEFIEDMDKMLKSLGVEWGFQWKQ